MCKFQVLRPFIPLSPGIGDGVQGYSVVRDVSMGPGVDRRRLTYAWIGQYQIVDVLHIILTLVNLSLRTYQILFIFALFII